jgi:hypothetical protein
VCGRGADGVHRKAINRRTFINSLRNEKSPKRKCASGLMILERETGLEPDPGLI